MGTIQGKLRDSCAVKQRPVIRTACQYGMQPMDPWSSQKCLPSEEEGWTSLPSPKLERKCTLDNSEDECYQIEKLKKYPFSAIGFVTYQMGKRTHYGSGFLISKRVVLTSASNLYSRSKGEEASNVCFIPIPLAHRQKQKLKASQIFYPPDYKTIHKNPEENDTLSSEMNFGAIVLEDEVNLQDYCGFLGVDFKEEDHQIDSAKSIIGYSYREDKETKLMMHRNKVILEGGMLSYSLPFEINFYGGPIMERVGGECLAIGIHIGQKDGRGVGIRFNQKMFNHLHDWVKVEEEEIDLRNQQLGKAAVKAMVREKSSFHVINLSNNKLGTNGLKHFPKVEWTNLHHLDLGGNQLQKEGIDFLIRARIPNLKVLNLWGNDMKKEGVESLILSQWSRLEILNLYNNQLGYEGLEVLIKKNWPLLHSLNLGKNNLDKSVLPLLKKSEWVHLLCLNLWGNSIQETKKIMQALAEHFCEVRFLYL